MVTSILGGGAAATIAATFGPIIAKGVLGLLPANASAVIGKVVDTARQGIAIAQPVLGVLNTIAKNDADPNSADISPAEMHAALAELDTPGVFEQALAKAAERAGGAS